MLHDFLALWKAMWLLFCVLLLIWAVVTGGRRLVPYVWPVLLDGILRQFL